MAAVDGEGMATSPAPEEQYPRMYQPNVLVPVMPTSLSLRKHIWWGAGPATPRCGQHEGRELMSSTPAHRGQR